jgi:hypothetical protein
MGAVMSQPRLSPNREAIVIPNAITAGTQRFTLCAAEFPVDVVHVQFTNNATQAVGGTNFFTLNILKRDVTFNVDRAIATLTTNTGGTALTAGVPVTLALSTAEDATNYTSPTYQMPQPYRKLRAGDRLIVEVVVTGTGVAPVNGVVRLGTLESGQVSGRGT